MIFGARHWSKIYLYLTSLQIQTLQHVTQMYKCIIYSDPESNLQDKWSTLRDYKEILKVKQLFIQRKYSVERNEKRIIGDQYSSNITPNTKLLQKQHTQRLKTNKIKLTKFEQ